MAAVFIVLPGLIGHAVGDFFHTEDGLVELGLTIPIFGHHGDVTYAREHGVPSLADRIHLRVGRGCQLSRLLFQPLNWLFVPMKKLFALR
jgi:hypothetical protein